MVFLWHKNCCGRLQGGCTSEGPLCTFLRAHARVVSPQQGALAMTFLFVLFQDIRLSVPMIIAIELQFRIKRMRLFIAGLHWCSLPSHVGDSLAVPCHRMPPDAATERPSEAAAGRQEAARRSPEGREKAARRPADDCSMAARRPSKSARRRRESRHKASRRPPFVGF